MLYEFSITYKTIHFTGNQHVVVIITSILEDFFGIFYLDALHMTKHKAQSIVI